LATFFTFITANVNIR